MERHTEIERVFRPALLWHCTQHEVVADSMHILIVC